MHGEPNLVHVYKKKIVLLSNKNLIAINIDDHQKRRQLFLHICAKTHDSIKHNPMFYFIANAPSAIRRIP